LELGGDVATESIGVYATIDAGACGAAGNFVEEKLHAFEGHVLQNGMTEIEGELLGKALGVEVAIKGQIGAGKIISKLAARQLQPLGSLGLINDVSAIEADGLSLEERGQSFIGRNGIDKRWGSVGDRARGHVDPGNEVIIQLAFKAETKTNAGAVAVHAGDATGIVLKEALAAYTYIAAPAEASQQGLNSAKPFLVVLRGKRSVGGIALHVCDITLQLGETFRGLCAGGFRGAGLGLRLRGGCLQLINLLLLLLGGLVALLQLLRQLLDLLLLRGQGLAQ